MDDAEVAKARAATAFKEVSTAAIEAEALWVPRTDQYEQWVCELACTLLQSTSAPALQELRRVVRWKGSLAELVLPYTFVNLAGENSVVHSSDFDSCKTMHIAAARVVSDPLWNHKIPAPVKVPCLTQSMLALWLPDYSDSRASTQCSTCNNESRN